MPYYEVVFETGLSSIADYADDAEMERATKNQTDRAKRGESGGPVGAPAERVAKVYKYDKHPGDYNPEGTMSADALKSEVDALITSLSDENGVVNVAHLSQEIRALTHPMVPAKENAFDSNYKMEAEEVPDMAYLESDMSTDAPTEVTPPPEEPTSK